MVMAFVLTDIQGLNQYTLQSMAETLCLKMGMLVAGSPRKIRSKSSRNIRVTLTIAVVVLVDMEVTVVGVLVVDVVPAAENEKENN